MSWRHYTTRKQLCAPSGSLGASVTPTEESFTNSAWVELTPGVNTDIVVVGLMIAPPTATYRLYNYRVDIGKGSAGNETVIATLGGANYLDTYTNSIKTIRFPIKVAANTRLAVRMRKDQPAWVDPWYFKLVYFEEEKNFRAIFLPQRWKSARDTLSATRIDWNNPISRGLIHANIHDSGYSGRNLANQTRNVYTGNRTAIPHSYRGHPALVSSGQSNGPGVISDAGTFGKTSGEASIFALLHAPSSGSFTVAGMTASGGNWRIAAILPGVVDSTTMILQGYSKQADGTNQYLNGPTVPIGPIYACCYSFKRGAQQLFTSGSDTLYTANYDAGTDSWYGGAGTRYLENDYFGYALAYGWNRFITESEARSLVARPWQLLLGARRFVGEMAPGPNLVRGYSR